MVLLEEASCDAGDEGYVALHEPYGASELVFFLGSCSMCMFASKGIDMLDTQRMTIYMNIYITENGLGATLFMHLNVNCDKWAYTGKQLCGRFEHS